MYHLEGLVQDLFGHIGQSVSETQVIDMLTAHTWDFEPKTRWVCLDTLDFIINLD